MVSCRKDNGGNSLAVKWLGLHAFTSEGSGSISGGGTKIPQAAAWPKKKKDNGARVDANRYPLLHRNIWHSLF